MGFSHRGKGPAGARRPDPVHDPSAREPVISVLGSVKHALTRIARRLLRDNRALVRGYFEHLYRSEDPYGILDSEEEARKREQTLATLDGLHFENALEIGCGEGILAEGLVPHCDELSLVDLSDRALQRAAERMEGHEHVRVSRLDLLADPLEDDFDLIVCSEVLVYIPKNRLEDARDKVLAHLRPGGRLLLVHSRSLHDDEQGLEYKDIGARTVHGLFLEQDGLEAEVDDVHGMYRITLLRRDPVS